MALRQFGHEKWNRELRRQKRNTHRKKREEATLRAGNFDDCLFLSSEPSVSFPFLSIPLLFRVSSILMAGASAECSKSAFSVAVNWLQWQQQQQCVCVPLIGRSISIVGFDATAAAALKTTSSSPLTFPTFRPVAIGPIWLLLLLMLSGSSSSSMLILAKSSRQCSQQQSLARLYVVLRKKTLQHRHLITTNPLFPFLHFFFYFSFSCSNNWGAFSLSFSSINTRRQAMFSLGSSKLCKEMII